MQFCSAGRAFPGTQKAAFENKQNDCSALTDGFLEMGFKARVCFLIQPLTCHFLTLTVTLKNKSVTFAQFLRLTL